MSITLINSPDDAAVTKLIISVAERSVKNLEEKASSSILDREVYIQHMGALLEMRRLLMEQQQMYRRYYEV